MAVHQEELAPGEVVAREFIGVDDRIGDFQAIEHFLDVVVGPGHDHNLPARPPAQRAQRPRATAADRAGRVLVNVRVRDLHVRSAGRGRPRRVRLRRSGGGAGSDRRRRRLRILHAPFRLGLRRRRDGFRRLRDRRRGFRFWFGRGRLGLLDLRRRLLLLGRLRSRFDALRRRTFLRRADPEHVLAPRVPPDRDRELLLGFEADLEIEHHEDEPEDRMGEKGPQADRRRFDRLLMALNLDDHLARGSVEDVHSAVGAGGGQALAVRRERHRRDRLLVVGSDGAGGLRDRSAGQQRRVTVVEIGPGVASFIHLLFVMGVIHPIQKPTSECIEPGQVQRVRVLVAILADVHVGEF